MRGLSKIKEEVLPGKIDGQVIKKGTDECNFIWECLGNPKSCQLIFRASEHGFNAAKFHEYCDNTPNTLVLARTEYGRTVGGFTPCLWNNKDGFVADETLHSCLISVDQKQIFKIKEADKDKAILCKDNLGPHFGAGCDFAIADNCGHNK